MLDLLGLVQQPIDLAEQWLRDSDNPWLNMMGAALAGVQWAFPEGKAGELGRLGKAAKCNKGAKEAGNLLDDLIKAAQKEFPNKAGNIEQHHVVPMYLGGDLRGPTVDLDAAYHQKITSEFRDLWPYGQGPQPSPEVLQTIMQKVYQQFPLPPGK